MLSDIIEILLLCTCAVFSGLTWWNMHTIRLRYQNQDKLWIRDQYL